MNLINEFNLMAEKIELKIRKRKIPSKYIIIFSFILSLKAFFDLVNDNIISFLGLMILSQFFLKIYLINIKYQDDYYSQNYDLLNNKLNYVKFMVYLSVLFLKFNRNFSSTNIIFILLLFLIYMYYSPCFSETLNENSETDFTILNGNDKLKRIYKKRDLIMNNFMFNDICSVIFLLVVILLFKYL